VCQLVESFIFRLKYAWTFVKNLIFEVKSSTIAMTGEIMVYFSNSLPTHLLKISRLGSRLFLALKTFSVRQIEIFVIGKYAKSTDYNYIHKKTSQQKISLIGMLLYLAPRVRFELTTNWLTANCSTAELPRNKSLCIEYVDKFFVKF
jgi:hypothetical protein